MRLLGSITVAMVLGRGAAGQSEAPRLRLGEVLRAAEAANPRFAAARAQARAAEARVGPASRPPDPELQFGLMNRSLPGFRARPPLGMTQIQLMQMVPLAGKIGLSSRVADARAGAERARAAESGWEARTRAAMAFYELYRIDRSLEVAAATLRLLQNIAKTAETMYAVGEGRQADVLRANVELARMREDTVRMEAMRASMAARLNTHLDLPADAVVPSPVLPILSAPLPTRDSLERRALADRPMLRAGADEIEAAKTVARLARREIWPDLEVGVQYSQAPMEEGTDRMVSVMIGATLPIFAGRRQGQMRQEMAAIEDMTRADLAAMRADTRGRILEVYADLGRARRLESLYRGTIVPQAQAAAASALSAYRVGSVDFMTLLDNQMSVNRYRQELFQLEAEQGIALAELEMLVGGTLIDPESVAGQDVATGGGGR